MILIPAINIGTIGSPTLAPQSPLPENVIAVVCDGINYTIYQIGDTVPSQFQG